MLMCAKCGTSNALGCVFCRKCGSKLDLRGVTSQAVDASVRRNWFVRHAYPIIGIIGGVVALVIVLALWANLALLGEKGTLLGARRVEGRLAAFKMVKPGESLGADPAFTENDLNGYFEFVKSKRLGIRSCSVAVTPTELRVRVVRSMGQVDVSKIRIDPRMSMELVCVPAGGRLAVSKAYLGHLPLVGPLRGPVVNWFATQFDAQPEWAGLKAAAEVRLVQGGVAVVVRK